MSDTDEGEEDGLDIVISGPDDGDGTDTDTGTDTVEPIVRICNAYRIDFEDGTTSAYVAEDDIAAIFLAQRDKPGVARVQITRVRKNVTVMVNAEEG